MSPCDQSVAATPVSDRSAVPAKVTGSLHETDPSGCTSATAATFAVVPQFGTWTSARLATSFEAATSPRSAVWDQSEGSFPAQDGP